MPHLTLISPTYPDIVSVCPHRPITTITLYLLNTVPTSVPRGGVICKHLERENGLQDLLAVLLKSMIVSERREYPPDTM